MTPNIPMKYIGNKIHHIKGVNSIGIYVYKTLNILYILKFNSYLEAYNLIKIRLTF